MKILSIETSCDETAAAVLHANRGHFDLLSNVVSSQVDVHKKYGGVVPEIAARLQMEMIIPVIEEALKKSKLTLKDIDVVGVTFGPGLVTSLTVGIETVKTIALVANKKLVGVNHIKAHLLANHLENKKIKYPCLGLIVSGGHTQLVLMKNEQDIKTIGQTVDDAVGEAFDKVAKILGLEYPGGPIISKLAKDGDPSAFALPRPMIHHENFNFSFSGLKTAALYTVQKNKKIPKDKKMLIDFCANFEQASVDVLVSKTLRALKKYPVKSFLLGGGVSANPRLRENIAMKIKEKFPEVDIFIPELKFTGDNAAMIGVCTYFEAKNKNFIDPKKIKVDPNLNF
jgi:N6-L-threonylcarbamoyladenine synthase